ncbi:hypothetical protein Tco_0168634 [Tanacetum coccineum]
MAYPCLHFTDNHKGLKTQYVVSRSLYTPYLRFIIYKDSGRYQSWSYSKKSLIRRIPHRPIRRIDQFPDSIYNTLNSVLVSLVRPTGDLGINECVLIPLVKMDDLNITMEEYIRLEEEKTHRHGKVYNWETATYGKIWYDEDVHDIRSVETEFPAMVFDDAFTSEVTLSCEPTVSPFNDNKVDFRIPFDESDDEDYTPTVSYFDDLDYFKDFEKEFPAIVYNDALTSKLEFLTEPHKSPQHIDEFNLKDKTSLSKCDEDEENVLYFNNLFPFNVMYPDDSKSDKGNDDKKSILNSLWGVRIMQKSQENGQNQTNTDTGKEREYKSRENAIKVNKSQPLVN